MVVFMAVMALGGIVPAAASGDEPDFSDERLAQQIVTGNEFDLNSTAMRPYTGTPDPVTLKVEVDRDVLPGPRYMAFGPSTIGISMPPPVFALLITITALIIAALFIRKIGETDQGRR